MLTLGVAVLNLSAKETLNSMNFIPVSSKTRFTVDSDGLVSVFNGYDISPPVPVNRGDVLEVCKEADGHYWLQVNDISTAGVATQKR